MKNVNGLFFMWLCLLVDPMSTWEGGWVEAEGTHSKEDMTDSLAQERR